MTSKLEAIPKICRCSLKLVKNSLGGGRLSSSPLHLSGEQVQQVASGYARLVTPFHCLFLLLHLSLFRIQLDGGW